MERETNEREKRENHRFGHFKILLKHLQAESDRKKSCRSLKNTQPLREEASMTTESPYADETAEEVKRFPSKSTLLLCHPI